MNYSKFNNIFGWITFAIAFLTYLLTMAPTASFWDCGEFISCANEFQVPHPPGPPIYLLIGRLFAIFAPSPETVSWMVNLVSVLSGAFTVLFTFWVTTHLAKKIVAPDEENPEQSKTLLIMFAGMVGGLACCFADSFWFNAVEAEVYALSSLCTATVVWLIFKWEARADEPHNLRWIVMIAFVVGLSIGVHLLNLLAIPALAYVYYIRKHAFSWAGLIVTLGISVIILALVQYGVIQYTIEFVWLFEKNLVGIESWDGTAAETGMGLGKGIGLWIFSILFSAALGGGIYYSVKKKNVALNVGLLSLLVIMIGYSSYMIIAIRANTDAPINENDPGNVVSMLSYMKREQYGDRPLLYGPLYNDVQRGKQTRSKKNFVVLKDENWMPMGNGSYTLKDGKTFNVSKGKIVSGKIGRSPELEDGSRVKIDKKTGKVMNFRSTEKYVWDGWKVEYEYDSKYKKFFPRMYSSNHYQVPKHLYGYRKFVKRTGDGPNMDRPTSGENMKFFWAYQMNHMYFRYFMWNFAGREGDRQDDSWETGLAFWKTAKMPAVIKNDPGKNHYYAIPLLLGLFGMVWHGFTRTKDFGAIALLFFFTGIAIIIYLNQTPSQPRERDYSYAGSFQTFAIWIGLGVVGLWELLRPYLKGSTHLVTGAVCLLLVPGVMAKENWDDHSRAVRYVGPDSAYNLLNSVAKNGILFTNGDNDTFPLWYIQEVEGVRTDVRVVNLSLLNTDWYIDQMRKQANESAPLPISLTEDQYRGERRAIVPFAKGKEVVIPVDSAAVVNNGTVKKENISRILSEVKFKPRTRGGAQNSYLLKQDYLIINILQTNAKNGWERPIYFSSTIPPSSYLNLMPYFQVEGLAYRVSPVAKPKNRNFDPYQHGTMDVDSCYNKIMNTFRYRDLDNPKLYVDEHIRRTIIGNLRSTFYRTSNAFLGEADIYDVRIQNIDNYMKTVQGDAAAVDSLTNLRATLDAKMKDYRGKAKEILDEHEKRVPPSGVEMEPVLQLFFGQNYFRMGAVEKAMEYYDAVDDKVRSVLAYYDDVNEGFKYEDRYVSALDMLSRYYEQAGAFQKAVITAELLYSKTLDPGHEKRLKSLRKKLGSENP